MRHRTERVALHRIGERQPHDRLDEIRICGKCPAIMLQRGLHATAREQHSGKIIQRLRIVGT